MGLATTAVQAGTPEVLQARTLTAAAAAQPLLDPADPAWDRAPVIRVMLYPQSGIAPGLAPGAPLPLEVRAVARGRSLALRLAWEDATEDRRGDTATDRFADAAAVQFSSGPGLPYVGMGEPDRPVALWHWRAGETAQSLTARGFGTLEKAPGPAPSSQVRRTERGWALVLSGPLPPGAGNPAALAFALWDGAGQGRAGQKRLSAWQLLGLPGGTQQKRLAQLAAEDRVSGDPARGRQLFDAKGCAGCHRVSGNGPALAGPSLEHAGGQHWPGYLRRAIKAPSAFIVPGYGVIGADGKRASLMPAIALGEQETEDLVAWLGTLK